MYVLMHKINENDSAVEYRFEMSIPVAKYVLGEKNPKAYGYCIFKKQTQHFTLDERKTDPYFLQLNKDRPIANGLCKEIFYVYCKLLEATREKQEFPETIHIATG